MGAWIEIVPKLCDIPDPVSLPSWERGLKYHRSIFKSGSHWVAPLVGAWIEIARCVSDRKVCKVAPLVGAWIEIYDKLSDGIIELVAPLVGAWIEILPKEIIEIIASSRSPRGSVD